MRAISLWQPWCWAILCLGKDVENRTWSTRHRGPLVLHAAQRRPTIAECESFLALAQSCVGTDELSARLFDLPNGHRRPIQALRSLPRGGVVGRVEVVGCTKFAESPWAFSDQYQWLIRNPQRLPFVPVKGQRGFFNVEQNAAA